jgi:hypothetical protein
MSYTPACPLPLKIAEYVNEHFPGKCFINHKKVENDTGTFHYLVYLNDDENRYCLRFSETGNYINQNSEPLYSDFHQQYF